MNKNNLMILCKVVDNFGDIGVLYRLAKALSDIKPELNLTMVVSNLESFKSMAREIDASKEFQFFHYKNSVWQIVKWDLEKAEINGNSLLFEEENARLNIEGFNIIIEGFQCGRPQWLEDILFSEGFASPVQILNIDYLTAEEYADDFHLLRSGTRKSNIKKRFFMPGFTEKTGGLILSEINETIPKEITFPENQFKISFFAYERNCLPLVQGIEEFEKEMKLKNPEFSVAVYLAAGKSYGPFMEACKKCNSKFKVIELPFLQQEEWDFLLTQMDFNFIRGEDSLSRAAICGKPYVWHAYIQDDDYQLVKVNALLDRMEPYFDGEQFSLLKEFWNNYNVSNSENFSAAGRNALGIVAETPQRSEELQQEPGRAPIRCEETPKALLKKLLILSSEKGKNLCKGFEEFSRKIEANGNLAQHLLEFIETL